MKLINYDNDSDNYFSHSSFGRSMSSIKYGNRLKIKTAISSSNKKTSTILRDNNRNNNAGKSFANIAYDGRIKSTANINHNNSSLVAENAASNTDTSRIRTQSTTPTTTTTTTTTLKKTSLLRPVMQRRGTKLSAGGRRSSSRFAGSKIYSNLLIPPERVNQVNNSDALPSSDSNRSRSASFDRRFNMSPVNSNQSPEISWLDVTDSYCLDKLKRRNVRPAPPKTNVRVN